MATRSKKYSLGFTLLELMIVVTIIGLLSAVVLVALNTSRESGRNAARISQIKEYLKAFELYRSDTGKYPSWGTSASASARCLTNHSDNNCWLVTNGTGNRIEYGLLFTQISPYLSRIPEGESELFRRGGRNSPPAHALPQSHRSRASARCDRADRCARSARDARAVR